MFRRAKRVRKGEKVGLLAGGGAGLHGMGGLAAVAFAVAGLAGCGASKPPPPTTFPDSHDPAYAAAQDTPSDPRISRSAGEEGSIVVLWPRVMPASTAHDGLDREIQAAVVRAVSRVRPGTAVEVRPSPERTCPRGGCKGASVSAVLLVRGEGCAVALATSPPGESEATLSPWVGAIDVLKSPIPFREPPESHLRPTDMARCGDVPRLLLEGDAAIDAALGMLTP